MTDSRPAPTWGDFVYDAFYCGAIGGSVVALFFLVIDGIEGRPLYTPSLMGSVLFQGASAPEVNAVNLQVIPFFTLVHFAVFSLLGAAVALAVREAELHTRNPFGVLLGLFVLFEWGFFVSTLVLMPGVMRALGPFRVAMANLLAAGAIATFLVLQHRPELWQRWKRSMGFAGPGAGGSSAP